MNFKKILSLSLVSLMLGSTVMAAKEQKIAVIDVNKVVAASPQVKALSKSQKTSNAEIAKFVKKAQADIAKQKDETAKKELIAKYDKELAAKKAESAKYYNLRLKELDKNITAQIEQRARAMGYTMVVAKKAVVVSADDITEEMIKVVK